MAMTEKVHPRRMPDRVGQLHPQRANLLKHVLDTILGPAPALGLERFEERAKPLFCLHREEALRLGFAYPGDEGGVSRCAQPECGEDLADAADGDVLDGEHGDEVYACEGRRPRGGDAAAGGCLRDRGLQGKWGHPTGANATDLLPPRCSPGTVTLHHFGLHGKEAVRAV
jgi:hypothetical protein